MSPKVSFKGTPLTLQGREVKVGDHLPDFVLTGTDMQDLSANAFKNKTLVILSVPSLDTPVCAIETKRFNQEATSLGSDVEILVASMDLPFAQKRWCAAEGVNRVRTASDYKHRKFGEAFGVYAQEMGLLARAVFVVDKQGKIAYAEYVRDISEEPNYEATLKAITCLR